MYELCDYFVLQREVVGIALFYVDRYFTITFGQGDDPVTKRDFQLVGLTALYIAIKTHGQSRPCLSSNDTLSSSDDAAAVSSVAFNKLKFSLHVCASTSREQFTARQIEECECRMLHKLGWRLNPIVPSGCVIELLVMFLPCAMMMEHEEGGSSSGQSVVQNFVYDCATYLTELAVSVAALSLVYKPSVIAYASVLAAVDILLEDDSSSSSSSRVTRDTLIEYDALLNQASCQHFELNKEDVVKAKEILGVMAPNVSELFPSPFGGEPTLVAGNELL